MFPTRRSTDRLLSKPRKPTRPTATPGNVGWEEPHPQASGGAGEYQQAARLAVLPLSLHLWAGRPQSLPDRRMAGMRAPGAGAEMARAHGPTTPGPSTIHLLVEQVRRRILPRRGIMAGEEEILITLGAQNALYLLTSLLVDQNTRVAIEEPGFPDMRNLFRLKTENVALVPRRRAWNGDQRGARQQRCRLHHAEPPVSDDRHHAVGAAARTSETRLAAQFRDHRGRLRVRDELRERALPGAQVAR